MNLTNDTRSFLRQQNLSGTATNRSMWGFVFSIPVMLLLMLWGGLYGWLALGVAVVIIIYRYAISYTILAILGYLFLTAVTLSCSFWTLLIIRVIEHVTHQ
jgi:hypothetical protein